MNSEAPTRAKRQFLRDRQRQCWSNIEERSGRPARVCSLAAARWRDNKARDARKAMVHASRGKRPGYRRIVALLKSSEPPWPRSTPYRLMTKYALLLERHTGRRRPVYPARFLKKSDERTVGFIVPTWLGLPRGLSPHNQRAARRGRGTQGRDQQFHALQSGLAQRGHVPTGDRCVKRRATTRARWCGSGYRRSTPAVSLGCATVSLARPAQTLGWRHMRLNQPIPHLSDRLRSAVPLAHTSGE